MTDDAARAVPARALERLLAEAAADLEQAWRRRLAVRLAEDAATEPSPDVASRR